MSLRHLARAAVALVLTSNVLGCGYARPLMPPESPQSIRIVARPVPMNAGDAARMQVGALTWAGGLVLSSPDTKSLGGLSGIDVAEDGVTFISQSDEGGLLHGRLSLDARGRLVGVANATLQRLVDEHGRPYRRKLEADAEDVTLLPGGYAISFEQRPRVLRYTDAGGAGVRMPTPPAILHRPPNMGLEALSWRDGHLYEGAEDGEIWRCRQDGEGACETVMETSPFAGYRLTGLDSCGGGFVASYRRLDVLHGWRAVIAHMTPATPDGGGPWRAEALATLQRPLTRDNMEGVACVRSPSRKGVRLYLVSDDNFESFQRTLLLAFDWPDAPSP